MDILRDIWDGITQWGMFAEDKEFKWGCGCGCLVLLIVFGLATAGGFWIGVSWK